jgi:hypothetical protein
VCVYCVASALTATALLLNAMWISEKELGILKGMRVRRK